MNDKLDHQMGKQRVEESREVGNMDTLFMFKDTHQPLFLSKKLQKFAQIRQHRLIIRACYSLTACCSVRYAGRGSPARLSRLYPDSENAEPNKGPKFRFHNTIGPIRSDAWPISKARVMYSACCQAET